MANNCAASPSDGARSRRGAIWFTNLLRRRNRLKSMQTSSKAWIWKTRLTTTTVFLDRQIALWFLVPTGNVFCTNYIPELISKLRWQTRTPKLKPKTTAVPEWSKKEIRKIPKSSSSTPLSLPLFLLAPSSNLHLQSPWLILNMRSFFHHTGRGRSPKSSREIQFKHEQSLRGQLHYRRRQRSPPPRDEIEGGKGGVFCAVVILWIVADMWWGRAG